MINGITRSVLLLFFLALPLLAFSQSASGGGTNFLMIALFLVVAILLVGIVLQVAENLMQIEAKQLGLDTSTNDYSVFPKPGNWLDKDKGSKVITLKKGFDINLAGTAAKTIVPGQAATYAIQPGNFIGMSPIPKVVVEPGEEVKAGDPLFFDKKRPDIKYCSPVSGEIVEVRRGAKRAIKEVVILADKGEMNYRPINVPDLASLSREDLVRFLLETGTWPLIRQRPFDIVADTNIIPQNIFISTFDTGPLAPDNNLVVAGQEAAFQKGLDVLGKLTNGQIFLGLNAAEPPAAAFTGATGVTHRWFKGPHPTGNVGIQIHHTDPIDTKEKVWVLGVQEVIQLGKLFNEGRFDASRIVALTGAELDHPQYVSTHQGACVGELLRDNMKSADARIVAGDVLSGKQKTSAEFLNFYDDQITVLKEGNYHEMFGWLLPLKARPSISRTFPNFLFRDAEFEADTNTHGEKRAFVVTGQYEQVLPMDIFPQHLMKAILVNDFERMEGLGIYELSEEDVALCEFVCTSKQPLQSILREGLEVMREQG